MQLVSIFFFSSRRRHTRWTGDWSSDVCSSDLTPPGHREPAGPCEPGGVPGTKAHPKEPDCQDRRNWPGSAAEPRQTAGGGKRVVQPWSFRLVKRWPAPAYNHSAGRRGRSKSPRIKKEHDYLRLWTGDFTARRQHSVRHFGCAGTPHSGTGQSEDCSERKDFRQPTRLSGIHAPQCPRLGRDGGNIGSAGAIGSTSDRDLHRSAFSRIEVDIFVSLVRRAHD